MSSGGVHIRTRHAVVKAGRVSHGAAGGTSVAGEANLPLLQGQVEAGVGWDDLRWLEPALLPPDVVIPSMGMFTGSDWTGSAAYGCPVAMTGRALEPSPNDVPAHLTDGDENTAAGFDNVIIDTGVSTEDVQITLPAPIGIYSVTILGSLPSDEDAWPWTVLIDGVPVAGVFTGADAGGWTPYTPITGFTLANFRTWRPAAPLIGTVVIIRRTATVGGLYFWPGHGYYEVLIRGDVQIPTALRVKAIGGVAVANGDHAGAVLTKTADDAATWVQPVVVPPVADILDLPTVETDDTLVLAPDGAGGVEFRAEAGGGGGGGGMTNPLTAAGDLIVGGPAIGSPTYYDEGLGMFAYAGDMGEPVHAWGSAHGGSFNLMRQGATVTWTLVGPGVMTFDLWYAGVASLSEDGDVVQASLNGDSATHPTVTQAVASGSHVYVLTILVRGDGWGPGFDGVTLTPDGVIPGGYPAVLPYDTDGKVLTGVAGAPAWATPGAQRAAGVVTDIAAETFGASAAAGATGKDADAGHIHAMPANPLTFGTPSLVLTTFNASGGTAYAVPVNASIAVFDTTAPSTQAFGDAATVGTADRAARRDHKHAMPANPVGSGLVPLTALANQASATMVGRVAAGSGPPSALSASDARSVMGLGAWSAVLAYVPGDIVTIAGDAWVCLVANAAVRPVAGHIQNLGSTGNGTAGQTSTVLSPVAKTVAVGDTIIVGWGTYYDVTPTGAVDNLGNTYSLVESRGGSRGGVLYAARVTVGGAITTITVSHPSTQYIAIMAAEFGNLAALSVAGGGLDAVSGTAATWVDSKTIPAWGFAIGWVFCADAAVETAGAASGTPSTAISLSDWYNGGVSVSGSICYALAGPAAVLTFSGTTAFSVGAGTDWVGAGGLFTAGWKRLTPPAAHVDPATGSTTDIINALIAAGLIAP